MAHECANADRGSGTCVLQAAAAADEVVPVVPPTDPPQRAHLPAVQGQEPQPQPQEAQEEIVAHRQFATDHRAATQSNLNRL